MRSQFPNLYLRGTRYYFRMAIPLELQGKFRCKEVVKSLKTGNEREALRLCVQMTDRIKEVFSLAYAQDNRDFKGISLQYLNEIQGEYLKSFQESGGLKNIIENHSKPDSLPITQLFTMFLSEKEITQKTIMAYKSSFAIWLEVLGEREINKYSKQEAIKYKEALLIRPRNKRGEPISKKKVQDHMNVIHAFFKWAIDSAYYAEQESPFKGLRIRLPKNSQNERHPFSKEQLQKLFSSPVYKGCYSKHRRMVLGDLVMKDSLYWIPLIGYFTGLRLNEICQLRRQDIKEEGTIHYIDVTDDADDARLKTKSSKRIVPIHPQLISLGLLELLVGSRSDRIFSDVPLGVDGTYSFSFSKKFARYIEIIGVKTTKTSFHSFRHGFIDMLKNSGEQDSVIAALVGHTDNSMTFGRYGSQFELKRLYEAVCKVSEITIKIPQCF